MSDRNVDRIPVVDHRYAGAKAPDTVQEIARRMAVARRNIMVAYTTIHRTYHHEKHTLADCPFPSCQRMRKALADLPTVSDMLLMAKQEAPAAKKLKVDARIEEKRY